MKKCIFSVFVFAIFLCQPGVAWQTQSDDPSTQLHRLFDDYHGWVMETYPEVAMSRGDYSRADAITDNSLTAIERRHNKRKGFLNRLHSVYRDELNQDDRISYDLFELSLQNDLADHRFKTFLTPLGGRFGPHTSIPQMAKGRRFASLADYKNYLTRLEQVPRSLANTVERLKRGVQQGRTPPQVTLEAVPRQLTALQADDGLDALGEPFENPPAKINTDELNQLHQRFKSKTLPLLRQSLARFAAYVNEKYLPNARRSIAATSLPDGEAFYRHQLRKHTTTEMTAREIHELGLREVKRIRKEMMAVIRESDYLENHREAQSLTEVELFEAFVNSLRTDERFYYDTPAELLRGYRDICKRADAELPKLFQTLPRLPYGVRKIPMFMAPNQTTAYYSSGDIRNGEPGWFYANTYALDQRPTYEMIPLALHEAVPGHHLQISLAKELDDLPAFRRNAYFTVFGEGWALYAERLGLEMGFYNDPYDNFGRLLYEMWRACRLVVDPGMHALGWSRQRAIDFMLKNTALSELNIKNEIDRYIGWPGQATAYKLGELRIRELRAEAEQALGEHFDLRAFHDVILGAGTIPLDVLEWRVREWIERFESQP